MSNYKPTSLKSLQYELSSKNGFVQGSNPEQNMEYFFSHFKKIHAAGGIIFCDNKILMIFRNQKWDFPKGKVELGESNEQAALRECIEECGLTGSLDIEHKLKSTYHCYRQHDEDYFKETHWYIMSYSGSQKLTPQLAENIVEAQWFSKKQFIQNCKNSYPSLFELHREVLTYMNKTNFLFE